jgi:hypothetical protein
LDSKGYYTILEVSENASFQEIKRAYRKLTRKYHPDRNNSSFAEDMIKKINASFEAFRIRIRELNMMGRESIVYNLPKLMHTITTITIMSLNKST